MNTRLFLILATAAIVLASCNKDENEKDNWNGEIRLASGVTVLQSRAVNADVPDKQIAGDELIGVYVNGVDGETAFTPYANISAKADGNGLFSAYSTTMYYPQSGNDVKITAYHPHDSGTDDEYDFTVAKDQSVATAYYAADLLYSAETTYQRSKTAHSLTFAHKLAKVVCTLAPGDGLNAGDLTGATVKIITPERAVKFNRKTGDITTASTSANSDNVKLGEYGAIVAPQTFARSTKFLKVTLPTGGELYYTLPADNDPDTQGDQDLVLAGGNVYTFNITVKLTGLTVTSTITPWTQITAVEGNATMDDK